MKKRRTFIVSMLLIAALALGIGYAALTDTLDINGTADVNQSQAEADFDLNVYFDENIVIGNAGDKASLADGDNDMANFTITSLNGKGDTATFTYTIVNDSDLDAMVTPSLAADGNTNATYFSIESDWKGQAKEIKAGQSATYTITVTLLATPTETIHGSFHIEFEAVAE